MSSRATEVSLLPKRSAVSAAPAAEQSKVLILANILILELMNSSKTPPSVGCRTTLPFFRFLLFFFLLSSVTFNILISSFFLRRSWNFLKTHTKWIQHHYSWFFSAAAVQMWHTKRASKPCFSHFRWTVSSSLSWAGGTAAIVNVNLEIVSVKLTFRVSFIYTGITKTKEVSLYLEWKIRSIQHTCHISWDMPGILHVGESLSAVWVDCDSSSEHVFLAEPFSNSLFSSSKSPDLSSSSSELRSSSVKPLGRSPLYITNQ